MKMLFNPGDDDAFEARCDELVGAFTSFLAPLQLDADPHDLELLLTWKRNYGDGRLGHWTRPELTEFLLDWCPRKLSASAAEVRGLPATVGLAMSFLAQEELHSGEPVGILLKHAMAQGPEFLRRMDDAGNFGMAKSIFGQLELDAESAGPQDFQRAIDEFNARPLAERQSITNPALASMDPLAELPGVEAGLPPEDPETLGPVLMPSEEDVKASAAASPLLAGFVTIAEYIGTDGKLLTDRGNLKIADAVALAELLDTGEKTDQQIGKRHFTRTSSLDFPRIDHWQWWAREAGAIRKKGKRIVANEAWLRRCMKDPVGELKKAFLLVNDDFGLLGGLGAPNDADHSCARPVGGRDARPDAAN